MASLLLAIIYLAFISLGLPDGLLGAAWPSMYPQMGVSVGSAGIVSMTIAACTVISSLMSERVIRRFGTGKVAAVSTLMTALGLFGFSFSSQFWMLLVFALPYGLGAGSIDAALNNYVALHYEARHMSWLHCFWGLGASIGPYIMGFALQGGSGSWPLGYQIIGGIQAVLTAFLFFSLPLWKKDIAAESDGNPPVHLSLREIFAISGAKQLFIAFFCYSAIETGTGLWAASYMVQYRGISESDAASWAALFYFGVMLGRAISGFVTGKLGDRMMIRIGQIVILAGILLLAIPGPAMLVCAGLLVIGLGCAPVYPSIIHSTPDNFGRETSQSIVGVEMACAYCGTTFMPPLIGLVTSRISMALYPFALLFFLILMFVMCEWLFKVKNREKAAMQK